MSVNLTSLAVMGLWSFESEKFPKNKLIQFIHSFSGVLLYCFCTLLSVSQVIQLFLSWGNLEEMTTNLSVTCLGLLSVSKVYTLYRYKNKLKQLIRNISNTELDLLNCRNDSIKKELYDYIKRARKLTYFFWTVTCGTISVFIIIPPIEYKYSSIYHKFHENGTEYWTRERPMIFSSWFPFDKYEYSNYLIAYAFHTFTGLIGAAYHAIWDMFIVSMMIHSIGQLKILQLNLDNVSKCGLDENPIFSDRIKHRKLVDCVNHHRYIREYTDDLNSIINPIMLFYFMICSVMLCCIGFQATLSDGFSFRLFFMSEYLVALMVQLFLFYWHGNETILENRNLSMALYSCEWYDECKRFKTSLMIMIEGFKLPVKFNIGRFYEMSLPTFLSILNASYSYYALLRQVQNEKKSK